MIITADLKLLPPVHTKTHCCFSFPFVFSFDANANKLTQDRQTGSPSIHSKTSDSLNLSHLYAATAEFRVAEESQVLLPMCLTLYRKKKVSNTVQSIKYC